MYIPRYISIDDRLEQGKVLLIYGPRQSGKTSLVQNYLASTPLKYKFVRGEYLNIQDILGSLDEQIFRDFVNGLDLLVVDEAQAVPRIGTALKLLVDTFPKLRIIATGSASFELAGQVGEPLVGRYSQITLLPLWEQELVSAEQIDPAYHLENSLIYGRYPAVWIQESSVKKEELLYDIVNSYLLKDILSLEDIKNPDLLHRLLQLLSHQVGNEVSIHELSQNLGIARGTVQRYLDLLKKTFIIFPLSAYSTNPRKEIGKKKKYYFYDLGIRNGLIGNFNKIFQRGDVGALWENFCILERLKKNNYQSLHIAAFFWRTVTGGEVDYVEISNGQGRGFEFKWASKFAKIPRSFKSDYPNFSWQVISGKNYRDFVVN